MPAPEQQQMPQEPAPVMMTADRRTEQPRPVQPMSVNDETNLRGGGDGGAICCGICAGLACFECLDCCC